MNQKIKNVVGNILSIVGLLKLLVGLVLIIMHFPNMGIGLFVMMIGLLNKSCGDYILDNEVKLL